MSITVHTNKSAMTALQNLNRNTDALDQTQNRINTGLKVSGAKDNSAVFSVAQDMRADVGALDSVMTSLNRATAIADVGLAAGEAISDILIEMREKVVAALDDSLDAFSRNAYDADFKALLSQLQDFVANAEFDGANLLDGSITTGLDFLADADGSRTVTLQVQDMTVSGAIVTIASTASITSTTLAQSVLTQVKASLDNVNAALAQLGSDASKIEAHTVFVTKLQDTLQTGVGALVDADMGVESARLQALQVQQQLSVQALSIANSRPQIILNLFQG